MSNRHVIAFSVSVLLLAVVSSAPVVASPGVGTPPATASVTAAVLDAGLAQATPAQKVAPSLRDASAGKDGVRQRFVVVQSTGPLDLGAYGSVVHAFNWPGGERVTIARVRGRDLERIAALPGVYAVGSGEPSGTRRTPDHGTPGDVVATRLARDTWRDALRSAPPWSAPESRAVAVASGAAVDGDRTASDVPPLPGTEGWYDVSRGHAAREAWDLGYRGGGVRVAVIDDAVDFAHPDLQGTWAVLPKEHPYGGWAEVFDPWAGLQATEDQDLPPAERSTRLAGSGMIEAYQTSDVVERELAGERVLTACFVPLQATADAERVAGSSTCDYIVPAGSRSGKVRMGHHPDTVLRDLAADPDAGITGEWAGVLVVDRGAAGTYDTVYVDLDNDRDFSDEKPMTREDPLSWRDANGDGLADVSGGLLYWIADGHLPFPASWVWGLESLVPAAGSVVGILFADGDHGTLCASSIVGQGRVGVPDDRRLAFGDLPGDGQPEGLVMGLAPAAKIVSVGSVYAGPEVLFDAAWRYVLFGHDRARIDDEIQIASNSYGFSEIDGDGWDPSSRLVDYYVRTLAPTVSFLVATGNGAPGYGTITAPGPVVALGVGASTQYGSTGTEAISDTTQITFGDVIPFSNRGPTATGGVGVQIVANGALGSGAEPVNFVGDGARAMTGWLGTSRSTPVTAGAMALVYQAYRRRTLDWPTWAQARSMLMAGARYSGYDVLTTGAGTLDAADAVRVAAGIHGIHATPSEWDAGGYRGQSHAAFAHLVAPGETVTTPITLTNPSDHPIDVTLSARTLRRTGSRESALVADRTKESGPGRVPDYVLPIDPDIPAGTELMVVRGRYALDEFDPDDDPAMVNSYALGVIQHTDLDQDGVLWQDRDGDGVVDHGSRADAAVTATWDAERRDLDALHGDLTPAIPEEGLSGDLAWFGTGCDGDAPVQDVAGKIALVERFRCYHSEKIANAQAAGAIGVVIFTDASPKMAPVGDPTGLTIPAVMIDRDPGVEIRDLLASGTTVSVTITGRDVGLPDGIDGASPIDWARTELDPGEFATMSIDTDTRNHWAVAVHHPRERRADGLYAALWHLGASASVTETHISLRTDFYAYQPWSAVTGTPPRVTVPPGGTITVDAALDVPGDAAPGLWQGAIFADYAAPAATIFLPVAARNSGPGTSRAASDLDDRARAGLSLGPPWNDTLAPAGFKLPFRRLVVPVVANVAAHYDWQGTRALGGSAARDPDATYDNGATWGTFLWNWREESGDWRFFFVDADAPPAGTHWVLRTTWDDPHPTQSDIDTRFYGPAPDRYSDPADPENVRDDRSDPSWYGPYTLDLLARSPYLVTRGSVWPFDTSSGGAEDWVAAPGGEGLHEVMLDNVLFSGEQLALPFETTVSAVRLSVEQIDLEGDTCGEIAVTPQLDLDGLAARAMGMSVPVTITAQAVAEDPPIEQGPPAFVYDLDVPSEAARFDVTLEGEEDDDLDLYVLRDADGDGQFTFPAEVVASAAGESASESVSLPPFQPAGAYRIWVHGYAVFGTDSTFDLAVDVVSGDDLGVTAVPDAIAAGATGKVTVCADATALEGQEGPAHGVVFLGPRGAPALFQVPVVWVR
jgi:subtilisin family serine protease